MKFIKITYMPVTTFSRAGAVKPYEEKQLVVLSYKKDR